MVKIIAFAVDKGGTGKTTTVVNTAAKYLGNNEGIINLDDVKKKNIQQVLPHSFRAVAGNGDILTKKGSQKIADVTNNIVGEFESQLPVTQDAVRDLIIDYITRYTKAGMRDMILNNRLNAALAEHEQ